MAGYTWPANIHNPSINSTYEHLDKSQIFTISSLIRLGEADGTKGEKKSILHTFPALNGTYKQEMDVIHCNCLWKQLQITENTRGAKSHRRTNL